VSSEALEARLDDLRQVCFAPSDGYSAGEWCEAANEGVQIALGLLAEVARLEQERDEASALSVDDAGMRIAAEAERDEALAALAVAREREQRAEDVHAGYLREIDAIAERYERRVERLREQIERIASNAESWHGYLPADEHSPGAGHVRALAVIATWARDALVDEPPAEEVVVSPISRRALEAIARKLDCTVNAALEEVVRESDLPAPRPFHESLDADDLAVIDSAAADEPGETP
jgi:hypothetical protein